MQPELPGPAHDGSGAMEQDHVPAIERMANEIAALRKIVTDLLRHVGVQATCKGENCREKILFIFHRDTGKITPYNLDGTPHYGTCVDRNRFHTRR
jgi:hypothetical protein